MGLRARHDIVDDVHVVSFSGELDLGTVPVLADALNKAIVEAGHTVAVDLDGVGRPDDNALGVMVTAAARASDAGKRLVIVCSDHHLIPLLDRFSLPHLPNLER